MKRLIAVLLAFALLVPLPVAAAEPAPSQPECAVILVPASLGKDPAYWTRRGSWLRRTLHDDLCELGFRPEVSLFALQRTQPVDADSHGIDVRSLAELLERVHARTAQPVDIVAHGDGAWVAWEALARCDVPVRNMIAIAPPYHGSVSVHLQRLAHELESYVQRFERSATDSSPIAERAVRVFEPLYHQFVLTGLTNPGVTTLTFEDWLYEYHPDRFSESFKQGQLHCDPGGILTMAYVDLLSLHAARYRYGWQQQQSKSDRARAVLGLLDDYLNIVWKLVAKALVQTVPRLVYRGGNQLRLLSSSVSPAKITDAIAERYVADRLEVSPTTIVANRFLADLVGKPLRAGRHAVISLANDGLADSDRLGTLLGPVDAHISFAGPGTVDHHRALDNANLRRLIIGQLAEYPGVETITMTPGLEFDKPVRLSNQQPTYLCLVPDERVAKVGADLLLDVSGKAVTAWVDVFTRAGGCERRPLSEAMRIADFGPDVSRLVVGMKSAASTEESTLKVEQCARPAETDHAVPRIVVERSTKQTTLLKPKTESHDLWTFDFGDGTGVTIPGAAQSDTTVRHEYAQPGRYSVSAVSNAQTGRDLRALEWQVDIGDEEPLPAARTFSASSIKDPVISVTVKGPRHWITGRPASYEVDVSVDSPEQVVEQKVTIDPGPRFEVQWPRPSTYEVAVAVVVDRVYRFEDQSIKVRHITVERFAVVVGATTVHD